MFGVYWGRVAGELYPFFAPNKAPTGTSKIVPNFVAVIMSGVDNSPSGMGGVDNFIVPPPFGCGVDNFFLCPPSVGGGVDNFIVWISCLRSPLLVIVIHIPIPIAVGGGA